MMLIRLGDNNFNEYKKVIDDFIKSKSKEELQELVDKAKSEKR